MAQNFQPTSNPYEREPQGGGSSSGSWSGSGSGAIRVPNVAMIERLEALRSQCHQRLSAIEALVRDRLSRRAIAAVGATSAPSPASTDRHERELELERAESRLREEAERWERERRASIEKLERDRLLLAQAWERLERERVQQAMRPPADAQRPAQAPRQAGILPMPIPIPIPDPVRSDPGFEEEMLRQFQSVRRDVRRNLDGPRSA